MYQKCPHQIFPIVNLVDFFLGQDQKKTMKLTDGKIWLGHFGAQTFGSQTDLALASAGSDVIRREQDLTASDMGMQLVPTELWLPQQRIVLSGTWYRADS